MAEWLKALSTLSDRPIVDETGLKGRYDVTMDVSMQDVMAAVRSAGANVPPPPAGVTEASEPERLAFHRDQVDGAETGAAQGPHAGCGC